MLSAYAPARRRLILVAAALVTVVVAIAAALAIAAARRGGSARVRAVPQGEAGTILLVPGYGGSSGALDVLAARLRTAGRRASVVSLPDGGTGDLRQQAVALNRAADQAIASSRQRSVDVVGYSAGGVAARLWVKSYGGAGKARRVITLGSPQHGTELAAVGSAVPGACPLACQQLVPTSELLATLNQGGETPPGPVFVSVWSDVDQTVVPPDSARLAGSIGMSVQSICASSTVAHGDLPRDPLVTAITADELNGATPRTLGPGDCRRLST